MLGVGSPSYLLQNESIILHRDGQEASIFTDTGRWVGLLGREAAARGLGGPGP